jgi:polysaccharide biosynthesis protein PslG
MRAIQCCQGAKEELGVLTERLGQLLHVPSNQIKASGVSIGFECLDRFIFDQGKCYDKLAAIGVKWARCQTG